MSKFQIGLLVVFGAFIVFAVILFSQNRGGGTDSVTLTVWGTIPERDFNNAVSASGISNSESISFRYDEKDVSELSEEFTEALAEGRGPDLVIMPVENLLADQGKLMLIPESAVKPSDFVNTFIKIGELFLVQGGTYALPVFVDPMVLYWNRDLLSAASFATPPMYWDQIYDYVSKLTVKDAAGNITRSALPLGEVSNIPNAKETLSLLMLQAGSSIVSTAGPAPRSTLLESQGQAQVPAVAALEFYTQFANPAKSFYSWNRSQLPADTAFGSGRAAMYLGFASELPIIRAKNPTLDLGIAPVPQSRVSGRVVTFGRLYGVAVSRGAKNPAGALRGAVALVSEESVRALTAETSLVPARRDLLSERPSDPAGSVFWSAALLAQSWLDPNPERTEEIFSEMVESVASGRSRVDQAVMTANSALNSLLESQ